MPIGIILNCLSVTVGGIVGTVAGNQLSDRMKSELTLIFGLCAIGMGINSVVLLKNLPAIVFSVIVGTAIGLAFHLEDKVNRLLGCLQKPFGKLMKIENDSERTEYMNTFITVLVLFCASANGIYGCLDAGFSGEHTILISKSVMDIFTAMIFACNLGPIVSLISIPQFCIFTAFFLAAKVIYPVTTPEMIMDFKGCGGFLLIATGFRVMKLKEFPLVDMIPALILVMPISWVWVNGIVPLLT
jgi:hypothetical protein